jgi:hypothetical protein
MTVLCTCFRCFTGPFFTQSENFLVQDDGDSETDLESQDEGDEAPDGEKIDLGKGMHRHFH